MSSKTKIVGEIKPKTSLIDYCIRAFPILGSQSAVKKAIANGRLMLNRQPAKFNDRVRKGDRVEVLLKSTIKPKQVKISLPIVFEDDYFIIVNKPGGIAVNGNRNKTVENAVANFAKPSKAIDALPRPVAVHRIDVPTKGLVLLAKTKTALIQLSKAFQNQQVKKAYFAVTHGKIQQRGRIQMPIDGKPSVTDYELIQTTRSRVFKHFSLVKLFPLTGRTHQLRIHLKSIGHLIVGDKQYAERQRTILGKGLFLCAGELSFQHPVTKKEMEFKLEIPTRFTRLIEREGDRF